MTRPYVELLHEVVAAHAAHRPEAPALVHGDRTVSYAELDRTAGALAAVLRGAGIGPGAVVPVLLPPSVPLVTTVLAVLKTGAAYAALDPSWPVDRLREVDALLPGQVAVTAPHLGADRAGRRIVVADDLTTLVDAGPPAPLVDPAGAPAMVFFTSGSTGAPKAVLSPHRATARLFQGPTFAAYGPDVVVPQIAPVPWDGFALEVWGPLVAGGTCVLVTERPLTPAGLRQVVARHGVNLAFLTTSLFHLVVEEDPGALAGLHTLLVGGERLSAPHAARALAARPDLRLVNGYGPAESAVFALTREVRPADAAGEVPLGVPVPHTGVAVLRDGRECAVDEVGELCVSGDGLAIGYLGDPALTAARFVTAEVGGLPRRVYRTGDLGRVDAAGVFHFHGRLDRQVKVRGHRVEPAGVERLAGALPGVRRAVVAPEWDGGSCVALVLAYLGGPGPEEVRSALAARLPAYSVPDRIVRLDRLPLTPNGKLDVPALLAAARPAPAPVAAVAGVGTAGVVAAELAGLGIDATDPTASLFALGGTSMTAVRLAARLGVRFDRPVPVSQLVRTPSVAGLAEWLDTAPAPPPVTGDGELTPMQQGFVLRNLDPAGDPENACPLAWDIAGSLDVDALRAALGDVHARHGYLSGRYVADERPRVEPAPGPPPFARGDLAAAMAEPFDLAAGLVWRAVLDPAGPDRWRLGVVVHHAALDGWAQHVLTRDLGLAYAARAGGRAPDFPDPAPSPDRVAALLAAAAAAADLPMQRRYWTGILRDLPPVTWPAAGVGGTPAADAGPAGTVVEVPVPAGTLARVAAAARADGTGLLGVLLAAVADGVFAVTGQDDLGFGVPVSLRGSAELQRPVGCLIDTVCVRVRRRADGSGRDAVRAAVTGALADADLPFADVLTAVRPRRTGRHPLYQVVVVVQDDPAADLELAGCRVRELPQRGNRFAMEELTVELLATPGRPAALRLSRDPARLSAAAFRALADRIPAALADR